MDYLGMQEVPRGVMNGSAQPNFHIQTLPHTLLTPMFQLAASHEHSSHDEPNGDNGSKTAYSDRAREDESASPLTSPSCSCSPSPSPSPSPMRSLQRTALDKPLEQLTEEDIMHLTRDDCRRYLKERGMRRPSWNKSQAIQQVLSLKGLFDEGDDDEKRLKSPVCPKNTNNQEVLNPQQSRLAPSAHKMMAAMPQHSASMVGHEASSISCKVPERHSNNDMLATHQPGVSSHFACPKVSIPLIVDRLPRSLSTYNTTPSNHATATPPQLKGSNLHYQDGCSQCAQTISIPGMEPSAQLTIFYSGMVNVYDNVPADKAQAVMLLAAQSNMSKPLLCSRLQSLLNIPVTTQRVDASKCPKPHYVQSTLATTEVPLRTASPSVSIPVSQNFKATQSEHQPSRKACLQRYLEKRRGRYTFKTPYPGSTRGFEDDTSTQLMSERCKLSNLSGMMGPSMVFPYHESVVQLPMHTSRSETSSPHIHS